MSWLNDQRTRSCEKCNHVSQFWQARRPRSCKHKTRQEQDESQARCGQNVRRTLRFQNCLQVSARGESMVPQVQTFLSISSPQKGCVVQHCRGIAILFGFLSTSTDDCISLMHLLNNDTRNCHKATFSNQASLSREPNLTVRSGFTCNAQLTYKCVGNHSFPRKPIAL